LEQTAKDLDSTIKPLIVVADMTSETDGARVFKETIEVFGKVDVLVNNAGTMRAEAPIATTPAETFFRDFVSPNSLLISSPIAALKDILIRYKFRNPTSKALTTWSTISSQQQTGQAP
jgi:NAD(P)-dependent dehydrogenase (short-subunit alcohol dehydrogenase family)